MELCTRTSDKTDIRNAVLMELKPCCNKKKQKSAPINTSIIFKNKKVKCKMGISTG